MHSVRPFDGKTAIVTGASRGIGRAIALRLGCDGARVILSARDVAALGTVREEIGKEGVSRTRFRWTCGRATHRNGWPNSPSTGPAASTSL